MTGAGEKDEAVAGIFEEKSVRRIIDRGMMMNERELETTEETADK